MPRRDWTREELIVAFNLYCKIPFGRIHIRNPLIIELAKAIGRTPSAVSWKLANFARLDPLGLGHLSLLHPRLTPWAAFLRRFAADVADDKSLSQGLWRWRSQLTFPHFWSILSLGWTPNGPLPTSSGWSGC